MGVYERNIAGQVIPKILTNINQIDEADVIEAINPRRPVERVSTRH